MATGGQFSVVTGQTKHITGQRTCIKAESTNKDVKKSKKRTENFVNQ